MTSSSHVSLGSSWLWRFFRLSLSGILQNLGLSDVFLLVRLGLKVLGRMIGRAPLSSHHIRRPRTQPDLSLLMLTLTTWLRSCLSDFSAVKLLFFFPLPFHPILFGRSHNARPTLQEQRSCSTSLRLEDTSTIWDYSSWETSLFSPVYLFIQ